MSISVVGSITGASSVNALMLVLARMLTGIGGVALYDSCIVIGEYVILMFNPT